MGTNPTWQGEWRGKADHPAAAGGAHRHGAWRLRGLDEGEGLRGRKEAEEELNQLGRVAVDGAQVGGEDGDILVPGAAHLAPVAEVGEDLSDGFDSIAQVGYVGRVLLLLGQLIHRGQY